MFNNFMKCFALLSNEKLRVKFANKFPVSCDHNGKKICDVKQQFFFIYFILIRIFWISLTNMLK